MRCMVKVGDTVTDIEEGARAGAWTVGTVMGSSLLGLTQDELAKLSEAVLKAEKERVRLAFAQAGADYVIETMKELPDVIGQINERLARNEKPKSLNN